MELKNCPFCSSTPTIKYFRNRLYIQCENDKCLVQPSTFLRGKEGTDFKHALKTWNKRQDEGDDL